MDPTSLAPGTTIGHYVIERLVGVGGSAAVYQARDPRACRPVAIKLLRADPQSDPERGRRLLHEARAYTRLVHPRIVTLFEVGEHEGRGYLVMEWVEGATLADHLSSGAMAEAEAVRVMTQVADGLSAAHALGLAHRDLKPANIMLTPEGDAKLLDFGLVKPVTPDSAIPDTLVTVDGGIRGTPAYMSPEQVRGDEIGLASDVFSFGTVLYEVLGGKPAFARENVLETLNAVASGRPGPLPPAKTRSGRELGRLIDRCLDLDPMKRPADARELLVDLGRLDRGRAQGFRPGPRRLAAITLCTALATAALVVFVWPGRDRVTPPPPAMGGVLVLPAEGQMPVITPDGSGVVHCSADRREIWLAPVGAGNPELVWAGQDPITGLTLAPDGRWVLFAAADGGGAPWVWEVPVDGGLPRKVTRGRAPAVSPDGRLIAAVEDVQARHSQLVVCLRDGTERRLLQSFADSMVAKACCFLPDGRGVLVAMTDGLRWSRLVSVELDGGESHTVTSVRGELTFGLAIGPGGDSALWCLRTAPLAPAVLCATSLADGETRGVYPGPGLAEYPSVSANGERVAFQVREYARELVEVAVDPSRPTPSSSFTVLPGTRGGGQPRVSPDGRRIIFQSVRGDLWVMERATGSTGPLLTTGEASFNPAWSPEGTMVAYSCIKNDRSALWLAGADGSDPRRLTDGDYNCFQPVWHPSARHLLFVSDREGTEDLYRLSVDSGEMVRLNHDGAANPAVSPDGAMVVFGVPLASGPVLRLARLDASLSSADVVWERPMVVNRWVGAKPRFSPDGLWVAYDQPSGPIGGDVWALPVVAGDTAEPVRLTAFPFPASLVGWFDWGEQDRLVVTVARNPVRLLLLETSDEWVARALSG